MTLTEILTQAYGEPNAWAESQLSQLLVEARKSEIEGFTNGLIIRYGGWSDNSILRGKEMVANIHKAKEDRLADLNKGSK